MANLRVVRQHFYEFMVDLHERIHETQEERPVEVAANVIADDVDALCFDEFQITDVQDASILPRVFEVLFLRGVVVVTTSNTSPPLLYSGGLNRHVHLPAFVSLIRDHCTVLGLSGGKRQVDYRRRAEATEIAEIAVDERVASGIYFHGVDAESRFAGRWQEQLNFSSGVGPRDLSLSMGRTWRLAEAADSACLVSFDEICGHERGEADFLALAKCFRTVLLRGVPRFTSLEHVDKLKRFVKLLDVLYDRRVRLVMSAAAPPAELFDDIRKEVTGNDINDLSWRTALYSADGKAGMNPNAVGTLCEAIRAADRAESRLREMSTQRYWKGAGDVARVDVSTS
jgi:predicted ATPase